MNKSDRVVATTTVTVDGSNVHATAVIEAKPEAYDKENNHMPSAPPLGKPYYSPGIYKRSMIRICGS